jgi:hypothetical protein
LPRRGGSDEQITQVTDTHGKDSAMTAPTHLAPCSSDATGVPPVPPKAHPQADEDHVEVHVHIGASAAYARITSLSRSLDVRIDAGMSGADSLWEAAQELRSRAARLLRHAAVIEAACRVLHGSQS